MQSREKTEIDLSLQIHSAGAPSKLCLGRRPDLTGHQFTPAIKHGKQQCGFSRPGKYSYSLPRLRISMFSRLIFWLSVDSGM